MLKVSFDPYNLHWYLKVNSKSNFLNFLSQNRQNVVTPTLNATNMTKQMSNLSLDGSKKMNINSQESVGGTTYYYVQNPVDPNIPVEEGVEIVSTLIKIN